MGGSKDFATTQHMIALSSVKVVTLTLGHPVDAMTAMHSESKIGRR